MKVLKAFIKPFEAPQRSVKIKIWVNFYFSKTFWNAEDGKGSESVRFPEVAHYFYFMRSTKEKLNVLWKKVGEN